MPYQPDFGAALKALQVRVFEDGDYYWHGEWAPDRTTLPPTVKELWSDEWTQEAGTHSVLDVDRVVDVDDEDDFGTVRPLSDVEVPHYFGTVRPTEADFEGAYREGTADTSVGERWTGRCTVLYSPAGHPVEIAFWGVSGD